MRPYFFSLAGKHQAMIIICLTILLAFAIAFICSLFFDTHQLASNTDLISSVYQVMGTIYAILLTFTLWGVWQNFTEAALCVQKEAYALLDLVHVLEASSTFKNTNIRQAALSYAELVYEKEWPILKKFTKADIEAHALNFSSMQVVKAIQETTPVNARDTILFGQALNLLNNWLDARRTRILIARGNSVKALWPLLCIGACVLFAFHGLFVANTLGIWATLLFGTSLVIGVTFYLIFTLDSPFEGALSVDAEPFALAINVLKNKPR